MMKGLAAVVLLLAGCDLYFGGDDVQCEGYGMGGGVKVEPSQEVRDPNTGICQYGGGGGYCEDECGRCDYPDEPYRDWGACYGSCYDLDETACRTTSGCYASFIEDPAADALPKFWGCWNTAPSGPERSSACETLDAYGCSRTDDCMAIYLGKSDATNTSYGNTTFNRCVTESWAYDYCTDNTQCGEHEYCDTSTCYPSPTCPNCPTCGACPDSNTCYGLCQPVPDAACEAILGENACILRSDCTPIYEGSNCTCNANGCTCETYTFKGCQQL